MLWQLAMRPPRWLMREPQCWGIDAAQRELVRLNDLDQVVWRVGQPVLATPLFVMLSLGRKGSTNQQMWWFCWHGWLSRLEYRRLLRACWRWRHD